MIDSALLAWRSAREHSSIGVETASLLVGGGSALDCGDNLPSTDNHAIALVFGSSSKSVRPAGRRALERDGRSTPKNPVTRTNRRHIRKSLFGTETRQ